MSEETQTCFCLAETAASRQTIGRLREQLPKARARYDKYKGSGLKWERDAIIDLQKMVGRLWEEFPKLIQQLNEYGDQNLIETTRKLYGVLKRYDYLGTRNYAGLCAALKMYEDMLPVGETIDTATLGRLMNRVRMGYYPTDLEHVQMIRKAVIFPESAVNILDPCCGEGLALETLADGEKAVTYGVELDEIRAEEAQNHLKRIGFGSFFSFPDQLRRLPMCIPESSVSFRRIRIRTPAAGKGVPGGQYAPAYGRRPADLHHSLLPRHTRRLPCPVRKLRQSSGVPLYG